jgi:uncharacterized membrane protein YciS (DUF1049 family)
MRHSFKRFKRNTLFKKGIILRDLLKQPLFIKKRLTITGFLQKIKQKNAEGGN